MHIPWPPLHLLKPHHPAHPRACVFRTLQGVDNKAELLEVFYLHYIGWLVQPFASADLAVQSAGAVMWVPIAPAAGTPSSAVGPLGVGPPSRLLIPEGPGRADDQKENTPTTGGVYCACVRFVCGCQQPARCAPVLAQFVVAPLLVLL
jgi:hypothetical protein